MEAVGPEGAVGELALSEIFENALKALFNSSILFNAKFKSCRSFGIESSFVLAS